MSRIPFCFDKVVIFLLLVSLAGCNMPLAKPEGIATISVTQAYQTVEARLTEAAPPTPLVTATPRPTDPGIPSPTSTTIPATATATVPASTSTPEIRCDLAAPGNPIDVTIPDNTEMQPGQAFTKIWRLQNVGTCTWTKSYAAVLFSGEAMSAPGAIAFAGNVAPGQSVDIPVDLIAPATPGTYQGNWKLRNASNATFGIGPNGTSPFWVRIVVVEAPTTTATPPTPTQTVTPSTPTPSVTPGPVTPTLTATPAVQVSGSATLALGDKLDLDRNLLNTGSGDDVLYQANADGKHILSPLEGVLLGVFNGGQPSLMDCQSTSLKNNPLVMEDLAQGTYFCYRTNQGLKGRGMLTRLDTGTFALDLEILTWTSQ